MSSGFPTIHDVNQPTQLQRVARMLNFFACHIDQLNFPESNNKGADQTAQMCRLVCAFDVRIQLCQVFYQHGP